ncbi:MAG TPA: AraC family transcriptional regulator, partial [Pseudonocardia sp.]
MDTLSAALDFLDVQAAPPCRLEATGDWALRFAEFRHMRVGLVVSGALWLTPAGSKPQRLRAGDGYLLARGLPYVIGSRPGRAAEDGTALFETIWPGTVRVNGAPDTAVDTSAISGAITFDDSVGRLLLDHLPAMAVIRGGTVEARRLRPALELIHRHPDRPWTVADLAATASMSRTAFAVNFKTTVGMSPLD